MGESLDNLLGQHSGLMLALVLVEGVGLDDDGTTAQQLETARQVLSRRLDAVQSAITELVGQ